MPQREPLDMIDYLAHDSICYYWTCNWVSQLITFNHMIDYVSTQLVSLLDSTQIVPVLWLDLISFSLTPWLNWVLFLIPYYFQLFILWCYSLNLPRGRWWTTVPIIFRIMLLVKTIPHTKYTRMLYPYIPGGFNYSDPYGMHWS